MRFVAVAAAIFIEAQRQVAVGLEALPEYQHVRRAVHRLQGHPVGLARDHRAFIIPVGNFVGDDEHVLAVLAPVAGLLPLTRVHNLRGLDLAVARTVDGAAHIGLQLAPDAVALGVPEHAAMGFLLEVEKIHLRTQLAVIALGGFFQPHEVRVQLLLVEPAGAIDAAEHGVGLIAAPVGTRNAGELERRRIELAGGGEVGAAAHVEPVRTRPVDRQLLVFRQFGCPFSLERLALLQPARDKVGAAPDFALQWLVGGDDLTHRFFDGGEVVLGEGAVFWREVVVEAIVGRWAECDLRAGEQRLHRFGQHVRIIVANEFERIGLIARSDKRERGIAFERAGDVEEFAVHTRADCGLGEARANRSGNVCRSGAGRNLSHGTIRQGDLEHFGHGRSR